jgi:hypothetical protein
VPQEDAGNTFTGHAGTGEKLPTVGTTRPRMAMAARTTLPGRNFPSFFRETVVMELRALNGTVPIPVARPSPATCRTAAS